MEIPENLQIDAILCDRVWSLVQRYCDGAWGSLADKWTVTFEQILQEAKRRGLECFVVHRPLTDGFWLLENEQGYMTFHFERGIRMYQENFAELEPAFIRWLEQTLSLHQLPGRGDC